MNLFALRHAHSISNEKSINASVLDEYCGGLSEKGIAESKKISNELSAFNFDVVITSPLNRTKQTIQPYLESVSNKPKLLNLNLVNERDLGDLSGTIKGVVKKYQDDHNITNYVSWTPPNGESIMDVYERAKLFINYLKENFPADSNILLCSHSVFLVTLFILLNNIDINDFYNYTEQQNGEIRKYVI